MRVALCLLQKAAPYLDGGEMASMVEEKKLQRKFSGTERDAKRNFALGLIFDAKFGCKIDF